MKVFLISQRYYSVDADGFEVYDDLPEGIFDTYRGAKEAVSRTIVAIHALTSTHKPHIDFIRVNDGKTVLALTEKCHFRIAEYEVNTCFAGDMLFYRKDDED